MGACSSKNPSSKGPNKYKDSSAITNEAENLADKVHNIQKPEGLEKLEPLDRQLFHLQTMVTVVGQNSQDQWLLVKDCKTNSFNFVTGQANPPEDFFKAGINRFKEQVGTDVLLIGVLKMEYLIQPEYSFQRIRAILYAKVPPNNSQKVHSKKKNGNTGKQVKNMSSKEIMEQHEAGGNIDKEVYNWVKYIENKGVIYPLTIIAKEGSRVKRKESNGGAVTKEK